MHILLVSNPAHGQINPLLAIAEELLQRGHDVSVCSADRVKGRVERLSQSNKNKQAGQLRFHSVGSGLAVEDLTPYAQSHPDQFHNRARHRPGDLVAYFNLVCEITSPGDEQYKQTVFRVRDVVLECNADMVIVDNFSPFAIDGVRLSARPYIQTSPGASCTVTSTLSPFKYPLPLAGASGQPSSRKGWRMVIRNFSFIFSLLRWASNHPFAKARREFRKKELGLQPVDLICDSFMTPGPGMVKEMVAAISFNVPGLDLYDAKAFHDQVFFVGPCFSPGLVEPDISVVSGRTSSAKALIKPVDDPEKDEDEVKKFLDTASSVDAQVIYINFGSIFYFTAADFNTLIESLVRAHDSRPSLRAIIKIPDLPKDIQPLPSLSDLPAFILTSQWIPSINDVLKHPAVKVAVHHGGGNSFNEAVYYGLPQLIISQWGETHDIAANGICHGISRSVASAPRFVTDEIVEAIDDLLTNYTTYQANALRWGIRCWQSGGTTAAANIVEAYAAQQAQSSSSSSSGKVSNATKVEEASVVAK